MKKNLLPLLIATAIILTGCGNKTENIETVQTQTESEIQTETEQVSEEDTENEGKIEVDKNLLSVEITLPAEMYEGTTQEELDADSEEGIESKLNDDGTVTVKMSKMKHDQIMKDMKDEIEKGFSETLADKEKYPSFTDIKTNDDLSEYNVTTTVINSDGFTTDESFYTLQAQISGGMYQIFLGTKSDNIQVIVNYINNETGEIIATYNSKDN